MDLPVVTKDFNKEERVDKDISEDHILYLQKVEEVALEEEDCEKDSVHAANERYEANEVLRIGMAVARNKEKPKLDQIIQDDKGGMAATRGTIEAPPEEKSVEMNHVTVAKESEGQPINHDEVAWEQHIDSFVMPTKN